MNTGKLPWNTLYFPVHAAEYATAEMSVPGNFGGLKIAGSCIFLGFAISSSVGLPVKYSASTSTPHPLGAVATG